MSPRDRRRHRTTTEALTAATVPLPAALSVLQRSPELDLPYPLRTRFADAWHGIRDRRRVAHAVRGARDQDINQLESGFATDFLMRLTAECDTRQESERRTTRVAIAVLDDRIVAARRAQQSLNDHLPEIDRRLQDMAESEPSDAPTTSAEQYDTPAQRRARRARTHRTQVDALHNERKKVIDGIEAARHTIDTALEARRAHWDQLLVRTELLCAHYNRRSRTYARSATRRSRVLISTHKRLIVEPKWSTPDSLPTAPSSDALPSG